MSPTRVVAKPVHAYQSALKVILLSEAGRRLLTSEPVTDADVADFRGRAVGTNDSFSNAGSIATSGISRSS